MTTTIADAIAATRKHIDDYEGRLARAVADRAAADTRVETITGSLKLRRKMLEAMENVQADLGPGFTTYLHR